MRQCVTGFRCICGFSVEELALSDNRLTRPDAQIPFFQGVSATVPRLTGSAFTAVDRPLSADASEPRYAMRTELIGLGDSHHESRLHSGMVKWNVAPPLAGLSDQICPPCSSRIERLNGNPNPSADGLVV
jgi:hypothetical protein